MVSTLDLLLLATDPGARLWKLIRCGLRVGQLLCEIIDPSTRWIFFAALEIVSSFGVPASQHINQSTNHKNYFIFVKCQVLVYLQIVRRQAACTLPSGSNRSVIGRWSSLLISREHVSICFGSAVSCTSQVASCSSILPAVGSHLSTILRKF